MISLVSLPLCFLVVGVAARVFVSPHGRDSGACADESSPCATLPFALKHGTDVQMLPGDYDLRSTVALPPATAVSIAGQLNATNLLCGAFCFQLGAATRAAFRELHFVRFRFAIADDDTSHLELRDVTFSDTAGGAHAVGVRGAALVERCQFRVRAGFYPAPGASVHVRNSEFHGSLLTVVSRGGDVAVRDTAFLNSAIHCEAGGSGASTGRRLFEDVRVHQSLPFAVGHGVTAWSGCDLEFERAELTGLSSVFYTYDSVVRLRHSLVADNRVILSCSGLATLALSDSRVERNDPKDNDHLMWCPSGKCAIDAHNTIFKDNSGKQSANCTLP
jgi:hypothetical protein